MKTLETLFQTGNYDSKNITNKSDKFVSISDVEALESDGATYELLEKLNVPVFKYRTQITIHGIFPELCNNYIGRYKNLFQNKNLSIGCKYTAIDRFKKKKIFSTIRSYMNGWSVTDNSQEYSIYKTSPYFTTKEEYNKYLPEFEQLASSIDTKLFNGDVKIFLSKSWFGFFLVFELNIGVIKESNVIPLIENVCGCSMKTIEDKIEADKIARELKREEAAKELEAIKKSIAEKIAPYQEKAKIYLEENNYVKGTIKLVDGLVVVSKVDVNVETLDIIFKIRKYTKSKQQKMFRFTETTCLNEISDNLVFNGYSYKHEKNEVLAYHKVNKVVSEPVAKVEVKKSLKTLKNDIQIIDYSEKAIVVIGDTKPIKDILSGLGGKFNFRLKCGAGWVFPKTSESKIKKELSL